MLKHSLPLPLTLIFAIILLEACEEKLTVPVIITSLVTDINTTTAVTGGIISDDGGAPIIEKGICWSTSENPSTSDNKLIVYDELTPFISNMTGLLPKTRYFVRAFATNRIGTGYGKSVLFTTLGDTPDSFSLDASHIAVDSAVLNGVVNPNLLTTTISFEWGTTIDYGYIVDAGQGPVNGNNSISVSAKLIGLKPGTTYHFRIKAENSIGISYSPDKTFKTLGNQPSISAAGEEDLMIRDAKLNCLVNPNYLPTTVTLEYGSTNYDKTVVFNNIINGNSDVRVTFDLSQLTPGTTYQYRYKAANELGVTCSDGNTFTTPGAIPTVTTEPVEDIYVTEARLKGIVNANLLPTTIIFEWGTTTNYDNTFILTQSPFEGNTSVEVFADLVGLIPETTYHYRIKAANELGTVVGDDVTFTTFVAIDGDGFGYYSILIGNQKWLTENLKTSRFLNGEIIGTTDPPEKNILYETTPIYQWAPNGDELNVTHYGRLYSWYSVIDNRKLCPSGWHVPSDAEWTLLTDYLIEGGFGIDGSGDDIAKSMASTTDWITETGQGGISNDPDNNSSGFSAKPAGRRYGGDSFTNIGYICNWWTSDEDQSGSAIGRELYFSVPEITRTITVKSASAYSVRCIRD